jgi:hypothetical protein
MAFDKKALEVYDTLVAGHAKAIGIIDLENMTVEQRNQLEHRLTEHGVVKPEGAPLLPGSAAIPSAGNSEGAIAQTTKGRAKRTPKNQGSQTVEPPVSPADFDPEIVRVFRHMADQGDQVGELAMDIFEGAASRRVQNRMVGFTLRSTKSIPALAVTSKDFLDNEGY